MTDKETAGARGGLLSACSNIGSIMGSLVTGLFLFTTIGTREIFSTTGLVILLAGFIGAGSRGSLATNTRFILFSVTIIVLLLLWFVLKQISILEAKRGNFVVDTAYIHGKVVSGFLGSRQVRMLMTDPYGVQVAVDPKEPDDVIIDYIRSYRAGLELVPQIKKILILGAGGFTLARDLNNKQNGNASILAVERDPQITALSELYFAFKPDNKIQVIHDDARVAINRLSLTHPKTFDLIAIDVFGTSGIPPFTMVTLESFRSILSLLSPDGMVIMNVVGCLSSRCAHLNPLLTGVAKTFPSSYLVQLSPSDKISNIMVAGFATKKSTHYDQSVAEAFGLSKALVVSSVVDSLSGNASAYSDNFAPVEWAVSEMLLK